MTMLGLGNRHRSRRRFGRLPGVAVASVLLAAVVACAPVEKAPPKPAKPVDYVWPLPPEPARIRFVREIKSSDDVGPSKTGNALVASILGTKKRPDAIKFKKPYGVYADGRGRVFVTDTGWGKLLVFDFPAKTFAMWGEDGKGILDSPIGVTGDSQGRIYVADAEEQRVVVFDRDGNFVTAMGRKGELERPAGIAINEALGRVYVVDVKKHHIAVYDMETGALVKTIGKNGAKKGEFNFPTNIAIGRDGTLYVVDTLNFRVQVMDPDGKVLKTIGSLGDALGQFSRPKGVAVDSEGNVYVVDAAFNNFQIFDPKGRLLLFVGEIGPKPGQFWLPAGAYIDGRDRLYIADQYNARIQVFERVKNDKAKAAASAD